LFPKEIIDGKYDAETDVKNDAENDVTDVRTRLLSFFFIAKFHNKFFSPDKAEQARTL
jgi:hypothetical protein